MLSQVENAIYILSFYNNLIRMCSLNLSYSGKNIFFYDIKNYLKVSDLCVHAWI